MSTMLSTALMTAAAEAETTFEIPMPAEAFGVIALGLFLALLALTFAFRGVSNKH